MRAGLLIGFFAALALPAAASAQNAPDKVPHATQREAAMRTVKQAFVAYDAKDCAAALAAVEPVLASPAAATLPAEMKVHAYEVAADCRVRADHLDIAYRYAMAGTALPGVSDWMWVTRLAIEAQSKHFAASIATIEAMHDGAPSALNGLPMRWFFTLSAQMKEAHEDGIRRRLLRILASPGYAPDDMMGVQDAFRLDYARLLLKDGDKQGAQALVAQIHAPTMLLQLDVDPATRAMLPPGLDLRAAVERDLVRSRAIMAEHPISLEPLLATAQELRQLGRPQEALALLETARARVGGEGTPFLDADEKTIWWWDAIARTEAMLGHVDRSLAALRTGASMGELGGGNVSLRINLAHAQNRNGKPADALATLAPFENGGLSVSPYGEAEMRRARGCANALSGHATAVADDLAWLRAHPGANPDALTSLLLCMNDLDGAATAMIARLDDPDRRASALTDLADYDTPPVALAPDPIDSKLPALKARPDVQAAIARAGGIRRYHLQPGEL